jgi:predicted Fe-S protein YdhL (DUF1289 family)
MNQPDVPVASPCISVCVLDEQDVCQGCFRTASEVTDWFMASERERREILERSRRRREAAGGGFLG